MKILQFDIIEGFKKDGIMAFEGDNKSESYLITLLKNKRRYILSDKTVKMIMLNKETKEGDFFEIEIINPEKGEIKIDVTDKLTKEDGRFVCQLIIDGTNGFKENSVLFYVTIKKSLVNEISGEIIADPSFKILTDALVKVDEWNKYFEETSGKIEEKYTERLNEINSQLSENTTKTNLNTNKVKELESVKATKTEVEVERKRIDLLTKIENGETEGNTELLDIRIGEDGYIYETAGESVRNQLRIINNEIKDVNENMSEYKKINRLLFEFGSFTSTGGEPMDTNTRIRSIGYYNVNYNKILIRNIKPDLYKYTLRLYDSNDKFIEYDAKWITEDATLNEIVKNISFNKFKVIIAKNDDGIILGQEMTGMADSIELYNIDLINIKNRLNKLDESLKDSTTFKEIQKIDLEHGAISNTTGEMSENYTRVRTSNYINSSPENYIEVTSNIEYSLRFYDKDKKFISGDKIWRNETFKGKFDNNIYFFKLVFRIGIDEVITENDFERIKTNCIVRTGYPIKDVIKKEEDKYGISISSIINPNCSMARIKPQYLTLCAVKENIIKGQQTKTVGWLYRDNVEPYNFYYANGNADNIRKVFTWKKEITHDGGSLPINYCFSITNEGDVICVYRGENVLSNVGNRQNPIVYPHEDYENPILIDFSESDAPTSWLQNSGCCSIKSVFYFCEYTRVYHKKAYIWKVEAPYTSRSNWKIVKEFSVSGDWNVGFKHCHMVDVDPYSNLLYASTGDDDAASKIIYSRDNGTTWSELATGEKYCRQLNFIWCEDYVYWATDSGKTDKHFFFRAKRKVNGEIDMSTVEDLYKFPNSLTQPATYHVCLIENPNGILILDRCDSKNTETMKVYFWDIENNTMRVIGIIEPAGEGFIGFRCEAVNHYQSYTDDRIICGFSYFPNQMKIFDNVITSNVNAITGAVEDDSTNEFKVNNIAISVRKLIG